ncbi:leucine-rich repeat flightless-interacting protein 2 isoform X2 [Acanthochromis polyacanthus]|uniref:leucine-rich repeat flightless-interacting protein 2 isoform X2 n=1 Tax=Acanthochromis polyacanthus TaxID=80966 RepID=UPI0022345529|nr:leucine-rich repeat flightless-interacting protein 2 isoform X2 [Acanthochromis polyacanthus]
MGTQGPGRKRIPNRDKLTAEDDALNQIAREAEARLAAKRAARAEAREIRMKELERQQKEEDSERYSRHSRRHASVSDDEERMSVGSRGSLRPSDYSGFLGSSSRASSRASSARASPVVEERTDRDFLEKGSRTASTLSAATLASLGGASSRRGSCDTSFSVETEASIRDMKDSLAEAEDKYRKAMVSNAQLHNDKSTLMYQVEALREELSDMEELLWEARRRHDDRTKEFERERQNHSVLQFQFKEMKETLRQSEELLTEVSDLRLKSSSYCQEVSDLQEALQWKEKKISALERQTEISDIVRIERDRLRDDVVRLRDLLKEHGIVVSPDITTNGDAGRGGSEDDISTDAAARLAQEAPHGGRESMLELRLKKLFEERESLQDQVRLLKSQLDQKNGTDGVQNPEGGLENGMDTHLLDLQRDANRQISDLKFKLVKSEQEVTALEQNVIRLEGQVSRYKSASENAEKIEDELKVEKRKLQRELRSALDRIDELELSNSHLNKRLEKMKANRNALLAQQ